MPVTGPCYVNPSDPLDERTHGAHNLIEGDWWKLLPPDERVTELLRRRMAQFEAEFRRRLDLATAENLGFE